MASKKVSLIYGNTHIFHRASPKQFCDSLPRTAGHSRIPLTVTHGRIHGMEMDDKLVQTCTLPPCLHMMSPVAAGQMHFCFYAMLPRSFWV